jgi:hypothetical protein
MKSKHEIIILPYAVDPTLIIAAVSAGKLSLTASADWQGNFGAVLDVELHERGAAGLFQIMVKRVRRFMSTGSTRLRLT